MRQTEVFNQFIQPIMGIIKENLYARKCNKFSDQDFVFAGLQRVLGEDKSGLAFLQRCHLDSSFIIEPSLFFKSLKSERRLKALQEVFKHATEKLSKSLKDADKLKEFKELDQFMVFASDGSYHEWAAHDPKFKKKDEVGDLNDRLEEHKSTKRSVQHFYSLDLMTHIAHHLTVALIGGDKQKEHDLHALKRLEAEQLRLGTAKGTKVLHIYDRGGIDYHQWYKWKNNNGIYFLSKEKRNSALQKYGDSLFDAKDSVNYGIIANEIVETNNGWHFRRITYQCPSTKEIFSFFLTTLPESVRPGVVAILYKLRWDVEKLFDFFKNKMEEKKAWGTSDTAKTMQAAFICLAHNLLLLMDNQLKTKENAKYSYDEERKLKNLKEKQKKLEEKNIAFSSTWEIVLRVSQIIVKLYRWLRVYVQEEASWDEAVAALRRLYTTF